MTMTDKPSLDAAIKLLKDSQPPSDVEEALDALIEAAQTASALSYTVSRQQVEANKALEAEIATLKTHVDAAKEWATAEYERYNSLVLDYNALKAENERLREIIEKQKIEIINRANISGVLSGTSLSSNSWRVLDEEHALRMVGYDDRCNTEWNSGKAQAIYSAYAAGYVLALPTPPQGEVK